MKNTNMILVLLGVVAVFVLGVILLNLRAVLLPFIVAVLFSFIFQPIVTYLKSKKIPPGPFVYDLAEEFEKIVDQASKKAE